MSLQEARNYMTAGLLLSECIQLCESLSQPFLPFTNTLLSLKVQHYSSYGSYLRFSSKYTPGLLFPLIFLVFFGVFFFCLFLNHPFLYTTCKIRALSNYFNNLAVTQNMKRRFKLVPFKGDATMTASHKHVPKY